MFIQGILGAWNKLHRIEGIEIALTDLCGFGKV